MKYFEKVLISEILIQDDNGWQQGENGATQSINVSPLSWQENQREPSFGFHVLKDL